MIKSRKYLFITVVFCLITLMAGFAVRQHREKLLFTYRNDLKQYVNTCDSFSAEEKEVISVAIDHIHNPETIDDSRLIRVYRMAEKYPHEIELNLQSETGLKIKTSDWQVDIGNSSYHRNFSAVIDGETLEFIMQIPIA